MSFDNNINVNEILLSIISNWRNNFNFVKICYEKSQISIFLKFFDNSKNIQTWTRTRISTNSNSSQRTNRRIIRNFKHSKPLESSKHKKTRPNLDQNHHTSIKQPWKNKQKRRKEKRRQPFKTPSFFFFFSSSFVFITHHHLHKKQIKNTTTRRHFGALPAPSSRLIFYKKREKIKSPITLHGEVDPSPWNANRKLQQDLVYPSLLSTWMTLRIIQ